MGIEIGRKFTKRTNFNFNIGELALPFIIIFITALTIGGRNPIAICIKNYLLGIGIGLSASYMNRKLSIKLLRNVSFIVICFFLFATVISKGRTELYNSSARQYDNKLVSNFYGVMEYMMSHYWGYQLRRYDVASGENLEYGICTFYGLGDINIPFSAILGIEGNLWTLLGVDYDPMDVYNSGVEGSQTTASIYSLLVRDFGVNGTFLAIPCLVIITHLLFIQLLKKQHRTALSMIPFLLLFKYWSSSNFNSGIESLYVYLIMSIIFDISQNNYNKYAKRTNY